MSGLVEVKTAELIGPALDWVVAGIVGWAPPEQGRGVKLNPINCFLFSRIGSKQNCFSTSWAQGGPLIEQYDIGLLNPASSPCGCRDEQGAFTPWGASVRGHPDMVDGDGRTPLIAACRAIVANSFGAFVSVPAELAVEVAS